MTGSDDDFEDFLNRRKPVFRRPEDEMFEPPAELDRVVLRQAREAIKPHEPMRVFSAPRWSMPIALAATLVLAFTIIFRAGMPPPKTATNPEVTVRNVAERADAPAAMPAPPPPPPQEVAASSGAVAADVEPALARREMAPVPAAAPAEPMVARSMGNASSERTAGSGATMDAAAKASAAPAAAAAEIPAWRHDQKTWMAEIQRLRDAGDTARADAEYAEFKRQQRAYAVSPDR
jgi:type IV secretory pathway VirB10-like protein